MARKKFVFVIVEGETDEDAIALQFERYFNSSQVVVHVEHGDITSDIGHSASNIVSKVQDRIKQHQGTVYKPLHYEKIIHIVDTDGAFIPPENISDNQTAEKLIYSLTDIQTASKDDLINRNRRKSANLEKLSQQKEIGKIPYQVYYMSSNLDHVLHDKQNLTPREKVRYASDFSRKYRGDLDGFIDFIMHSEFSVVEEYVSSWNFVKESVHSLQRYSNLGILFQQEDEN